MKRVNTYIFVSCLVGISLVMLVNVWQLNKSTGGLNLWMLQAIMWLMLLSLVYGLWTKMNANIFELVQLLKRANTTDLVTGLGNRQQLLDDLETIRFPNLGFIKIINYHDLVSQHGPAITDGILQQAADILSNFNDPRLQKSTAYRIESDIFAILEDQNISHQGIGEITANIVKALMLHNYSVGDGLQAKIFTTVGGVNYKEDSYVLANMALQEAELNQLPYYFIEREAENLPVDYLASAKRVHELQMALATNQIKPYFQPIFCAKSRQVVKYECLARWIDTTGKVVMVPEDFVALANRAHVYYKITRTILSQAITFAQEHQVCVAVNITVSDIRNKKTRLYIYNQVERSGVSHLIQFELLENENFIEESKIVLFIEQIQSLGAKVGLDDLGKGYSNIERLINLPVNFVKIDRSIMENLTENPQMQKMAQSIIALAHQKDLMVTAEFCANEQITQMAIALGADLLQGFHLGEPVASIPDPT